MQAIKYLLLIIYFCCTSFLIAQRANNWFFGTNAGLSFSSTPPSTLSSGQTTNPDNSSTISDVNGNLLFYTNGLSVWNNQHTVMSNGTGLIGNSSAGQCALIVPIPCDPNKYVIFHVTEFSSPGYLNYTVVDMSLNGGLGDVVGSQKNISLGSGWTEKLCAYYNSVSNNYWLVSHKWNSNQFVAFEVNSTSIATNSVVSSIGSVHNCGTFGSAHDAMGQLTISPDGTKLINALTCADKYELFDFNSATGVISNSISITGTGGNAWGTAFSPDSKKIYTNTIFGQSILQYDINTYSQSAILASQYSVVTVSSSGYNFGYMELGPDNKLYIAKPSANAISVVNNPNVIGSGCNFSLSGQSLGNKSSNHGLSRIAYNIPSWIGTFSISASPNGTIGCSSQTITLSANATLSASSYTWAGPGILGSVNNQSVLVNAPGIYTCTIPTCTNVNTSVVFTVVSSVIVPTLVVSPFNPSVCLGNSLSLTANGATSYTWQPGSLTGSIQNVSPVVSTVYTITGSNTNSCSSSTTLAITVFQNPSISINPTSATVCAGNNFTFTQSGASSYSWSPVNFQTTLSSVSFSLNTGAQLTVTGTSTNGCKSKTTVQANVSPTPTLAISPLSSTACIGSIQNYTLSGANTYTWLPGSLSGSNISITIPSNNTTYTILGLSVFGCSASITKFITVVPSPTINAVTNPTSTCAGGTATLSVNGANSYTWTPGLFIGQTFIVNPLSTTIYTVLGESNSCISSTTVMVANPLSPTLSSSGNLSCNNTSSFLYISANSSTYSLLWTGPSFFGSPTGSVINVSLPGTYSCVLTDTITNCSATETVAITTNIGPLPISIIPSNTLSCFPGPAVNLLISSSANYTWFPVSQVTPSNGPLVSVSPSVTTIYTVLATLGVCSGSAAITISVVPTPSLQLANNSITICSGKTTSLQASGASTYFWQPGNFIADNPLVSPPVSTIYTVVGSVNTCTTIATLTVNVLPSPSFTSAIYPSSLCVGNSATLSSGGAPSILWTAPGFTSSATTLSVNPFSTTIYTATATNTNACTSTHTLMLTVKSGPAIFAFISDTLICAGETVSLSAGGATSYTWLPMNQIAQELVVAPTVSGNYTVLASNSVCLSYATVYVGIDNCIKANFGVTQAASKPIVHSGNFYLIHFTVTAINNSVQELERVSLNNDFRATFPFPSDFTVSSAPRTISQNSQLMVNSNFDGRSNLSLTMPESSKLSAGKRDSLTFSILLDPHGISGSFKNWVIGFADFLNVQTLTDTSNTGFEWDPDLDGNPNNNNDPTILDLEIIELFIPEGFSPNNDGNNDLFMIKGLNGRKVNLILFNRWGNKIYSQNDYQNDWDGKANIQAMKIGQDKLPEGVYYYILEFQDGNTETKTGFVVLSY